MKNHAELFAVQDASGAFFNHAVIEIIRAIKRDGPGIWDSLAASAKRLRYLLVTEPAPFHLNSRLSEALRQVHEQADQLLGATNNPELIRGLLDSSVGLPNDVSPVGSELVRSVLESGTESSLVVVANPRAKEAVRPWLAEFGIRSLTLGDLKEEQVSEEITYFVGPPRFFPSQSVTAPFTNEITFVFPSWFSDRRLPQSALGPISEGAIQIEGKLFEIGALADTENLDKLLEVPDVIEDDLMLQPNWGQRQSGNREPKEDEVEARKLLLSGGFALWLDDDGDRIRALDPRKEAGHRVRFMDIAEVQAGTYLLLREGASERDTLQELAFKRLGSHGKLVRDSQAAWKAALSQRIESTGVQRTESELRALGVSAFKQIRSWSLPHTIRPQKDKDFDILLGWLERESSIHMELANRLRQEVLRASRQLRDRLESAADDTDINQLELNGHMNFEMDEPGYHGMFAARILAISPFTEIVSRSEIRLPFQEDSAQWLE